MRRSLWVLLLLGTAAAAHGQLITEHAGASSLLISGAGAVTGANGTFFRSDINLVNYGPTDEIVRIDWLPAPGGSPSTKQIVIPKGTGISSEDFVSSELQQSGLGAILVTALTSNGQFDSTGKLYATSRIWSNQPGLSSGTVSQTFPVISVNDISSPATMQILGQRRDDRYRTNVGIVNLSTFAQDFRIVVVTNVTTEQQNVHKPALSMQQVPLTGIPVTTLQIAVTNTSAQPTASWVAYGSSVDNVTGDSWSSLAFYVP